jgi:tRNA threonylcarbamoyladenosine biosynthesis protein TsaB
MLAGSEAVGPASEVLLPQGGGAWVAAGRGLTAWPALAERCRLAGAMLHPELLPRASEVLIIARGLAAAGQIVDPELALPVYVRDRVAEPAP